APVGERPQAKVNRAIAVASDDGPSLRRQRDRHRIRVRPNAIASTPHEGSRIGEFGEKGVVATNCLHRSSTEVERVHERARETDVGSTVYGRSYTGGTRIEKFAPHVPIVGIVLARETVPTRSHRGARPEVHRSLECAGKNRASSPVDCHRG